MNHWEDLDPDFFAISWPKGTEPPAFAGKPCISVPCPSFEDAALDVIGVCICRDLEPGQLYVQGCSVHDPAIWSGR